jgi:predicted house-cleaning noncanonical NTP pyrophosphatase (MazG superfamily)
MTKPLRKHRKLVRDLIPEIIRTSGGQPVTRILGDAEYRDALAEKLREEVAELEQAERRHKLEEIADIFEVLSAIAASEGHTLDEVQSAAEAKRVEKGGFAGRIWLERS